MKVQKNTYYSKKALSLTNKNIRQEIYMVIPAILLLVVFMVIPFFSAFKLSLTNQRLISGPVGTKFIGLRNYIQIFKDPEFWQAFVNILKFAVMVIPLQCGFALLVANWLNKVKYAKGILRSIFFLPYITPMVIVASIWLTIYQYPDGLMNLIVKVLSFGQAKPIEWLGNEKWALPAIVFLSAWQAYGFQMIIYLGGLQNIPDSLYEAAGIDGASSVQQFFHITWPSLRDTNVLVLLVTTIQALKLFTQVNIMTKGGPNGATNTIVNYIYQQGFTAQKIGYASAASVLLFILILVIFLVQNALLNRKEK